MPTERLSMRLIRDVLRLKHAQRLSERAIAASLGLGKGTVGAYLGRARKAGLTWPLPETLTDDDLELLLFPAAPSVPDHERPVPDWSVVDRELRRPGVTRALLWEEYRAAHPLGFGYAWFCEHYEAWKGRVRPTMRQTHVAGEKVFVDFAGDTAELIDAETGEVRAVGDRTRRDHLKNIAMPNGIEAKFGNAPTAVFEDKKIRGIVNKWREQFSPGTGDNLFATLQRIVSWACDNGHFSVHNLLKVKRRAKTNRSDIIWTTEEIDIFRAKAPRYVSNILLVASETGLRPGDLARLGWQQIQVRDDGTLRILIKTNKSGRNKFASVPVTPRLEEFLVTVPKDQPVFLLSENGEPFEAENSLGKLVSKWRDRLGIRKELHFYDARGTAVTRLVAAGCTVGELAAHMGWSFSHASAMLDRYAKIDPNMTDGIREKLVAADEKKARVRAKTERESGRDDQSSPT